MLGDLESYQRMVEEIEDYAILLLSEQGIVENWNKGAGRIKGYDRDEIVGKHFSVFFTEEDRARLLPEQLLATARNEGKATCEGWGLRKDGSLYWNSTVITGIHDNNGQIIGFSKITRDLTERKNAEEELKRLNEELAQKVEERSLDLNHAEKKFMALLDHNFDFISMKDENGNILYLSPSTVRIIGFSIEEIKGKNAVDFFHPDDIADVVQRMETALANPGVPIWGRNRMVHKDGHYIWVEGTTTNLIKDENVRALVGNFRDITDRKIAEESINESKAQLQHLLKGMGDAFVSLDNNWKATYANDNALVMMRKESEEVLGECLWDIFPDVLGTIFERELKRVMDEKVTTTFEALYDTYGMWLEVRAYPHQEGIAVFVNDISDRKKAEDTIISSEHKFRALIENSADAISMFDETGAIIYQSRSAERISGFSIDEVHGAQAASMVHPEDTEKVHRVFKKAILNPGIPQFSAHRIKHKTQGWIHVEGTLNNLLHDENVKAVVSNFRDITERKEAELKIVHANRLYAFISNINQTIVHVRDEQTVFKEACRIAVDFGKFSMAWIGMIDQTSETISLLEQSGMPREDIKLFTNAYYEKNGPVAQVLASGSYYICNNIQKDFELESWKPYSIQRKLNSEMVLPIKKSGEVIGTFNLYSTEVNFFNEQEINLLVEAAGDISFALDVFEKDKLRREAEENLEKNEFRLNEAQQIAHLGNWEIDFTTGKDTWSDEACRILGYVPGEEMPSFESFLAQIHPDDMAFVKKVIRDSERETKNAAFTHRILRKDGEIRHIYSESKFEYDEHGRTERLHGIIHDVTASKIAEENLAQSEANLRLIMDLIPQSIFARNIKGEYLFVNNCFAAYYGLTPQDIINKSVFDIAPVKEESEVLLHQDSEVINSGKTIVFPEISFTDHTGVKRYFHSVKVPYMPAGQQEKAVLGIAIDVTNEKLAETERTKMIGEIVQRNKDLEQFSYIISHNLRSPVANIIGITGLLEDGVIEREEEKDLMVELSNSAQKLDGVIKDINTVLQVKHEVGEKREIVHLSELAEDIEGNLEKIVRREKAKITYDFSAMEEIFVFKSYLYSIFYNLVTNSLKYRQPEHAPVISISSFKTGNKYGLIFKDNGLGIDLEKKKDQVFGLYKRFHFHVEGKGMGLYMVKMQVETLGGKVTIHSEVNKGTEFRIEFETTE